jgi:hypothetical protein
MQDLEAVQYAKMYDVVANRAHRTDRHAIPRYFSILAAVVGLLRLSRRNNGSVPI